METFFGKEAAAEGPGTFFRLLWRERKRLQRFSKWAEERRREMQRHRFR
jgi:hypothetical protein